MELDMWSVWPYKMQWKSEVPAETEPLIED